MKAVLISIQPKWVEKIARSEKTIEVRKTKPKLETPFKCYIYETQGEYKTGTGIFAYAIELKGTKKGRGKVIGEFVCKGIMQPNDSLKLMAKQSCLTERELLDYSKGKTLYGWRIADLKIYDKPKELREFTPICRFKGKRCEICCFYEETFGGCCATVTRPPQSWGYVEDLQNG